MSVCMFTGEASRLSGAADTPSLHSQEEDVVDNICGDTVHFTEAGTSLPVHARSPPIGPLAGHVLTRG